MHSTVLFKSLFLMLFAAEEAKINVLQKELTPFFGDLTTSVAYRTSHAAAPVDRFSMLENMLDWNADLREFKYLERFQSQQAVGAMLEKKFLDLANYSKEVRIYYYFTD